MAESSIHTLCGICCDQFTTTTPPIEIKVCKHYFHEPCIKRWTQECGTAKKKANCPYCKAEFEAGDIQINKEVLSLIIKASLKVSCKFRLMTGQEIPILVDQSNDCKLLFEYAQIYAKAFSKGIGDLQLTINGNQYTLAQYENKTIYDLKIKTGDIIEIGLIQAYFQVFLKTLDVQQVVLNVNSQMSILEFSQLVEIQTGVPKEAARFQVQSKPFDSKTPGELGSLPITKGSTIHQLGRLRGGKRIL